MADAKPMAINGNETLDSRNLPEGSLGSYVGQRLPVEADIPHELPRRSNFVLPKRKSAAIVIKNAKGEILDFRTRKADYSELSQPTSPPPVGRSKSKRNTSTKIQRHLIQDRKTKTADLVNFSKKFTFESTASPPTEKLTPHGPSSDLREFSAASLASDIYGGLGGYTVDLPVSDENTSNATPLATGSLSAAVNDADLVMEGAPKSASSQHNVTSLHMPDLSEASRHPQQDQFYRRSESVGMSLQTDDIQVATTVPLKNIAYLRQDPFVRQGKLMDLDVLINDVMFSTIPDTGAHINAIPFATLKILRQRIEKRNGKNDIIRLGNDTSTGSLFQVLLHCRLPKIHPGRYRSVSAEFHVFEKLATGVAAIVGFEFLKATQILTTQSFRLKNRITSAQHIPRCMSIGPILASGLRLKIFLNHRPFLAVPDTGSEINLISRSCASKNSFEIVRLSEHEQQQVEFADGTVEDITEKVAVIVHAADCSSAPALVTERRNGPTIAVSRDVDSPSTTTQTFYVLKQLAFDVILSQSLLHSMDAWNRHPAAFEVISAPVTETYLCTIFSRKTKQKTKETAFQCRQREVARVAGVKLERKALEAEKKRVAGDAVKVQTVQQKLDNLQQKADDEHAAYLAALATLTATT